MPTSTAPASTAPVPTVTVSGTVQDGAAPSCRLLFTVDRHYLLLGPQAATLAVDSTVTVTGHLAAGGRFSCGGIPLSVTGVLRR
ncbi:MAG TPA: hypothetical protein VGN54_10930 [Mycobacteriales bacterium]|nr:hypothetical protein [Mycobacteriales bacterium]